MTAQGGPAPAAPGPDATPTAALRGAHAGLAYGSLGLPLAFVALPLYVLLPAHYAATWGLPLGALGAVLLGARLFDALADPLIGWRADHWLQVAQQRLPRVAWGAAALLLAGFIGLFFPPPGVQAAGEAALLAWCAALLGLTYLGYSALTVLHQAWGTALGGDAAQRARVVAWREGLALLGVVLASVLPALAGLGATSAVLGAALGLGLWALARAPRPRPPPPSARAVHSSSLALPWRNPAFRALLGVYLLNGVASAVPATLVLFFIRDRLGAPAWEPLFLASYFTAAAASLPLWVKFIARRGLRPAWGAGMVLAVLSFSFAALLGSGDVAAFWAVCVASGLALGADLAAPGALLTGVVQRAGHSGQTEGRYLGWWHFATKLNLALAAGLALPLLGALGYAPGAREPAALQALTLAYCALPCALKLAAAALLWRWGPRIEPPPVAQTPPAPAPHLPTLKPATPAHPAKAPSP